MKPKLLIILLAILSFSTIKSYAQKAPMKFGKVDIEDLEMTEYPSDPSAPAVVLCSYGYYDNDSYQFIHTIRVKIFKKEGYDFATRKFSTSDKSSVRGRTYNLVNGEIVTDKLSNKSIFVERVTDNYHLLNVAMPNVKEGSIIDLEIKYFGFVANWYFQESIPVAWSELIIETPEYITFRKNFFGYERLAINEYNRWVAKDMPAFHMEPFMDSRENYITKFEFDLISIVIPGYYYEDIASNWEELSESLIDNTYFGDVLKTGNLLNKKIKEIDETYDNEEAKLKAAIELVQTVEFNGKDRLFSSKNSLNYMYEDKIGNSADINLMLIRALKKLGFHVYPIALSTKDNGLLSPVYPSIRRLNYVLACVKLNNQYVLVDATDKLLPYNLIPPKCINWRGRLIDEDSTRWVDLMAKQKDKDLVYYDLKLNEDLSLSGKLSHRRNDYAAYNFRKELTKYNSIEEYTDYLAEKHHGLEIENAEIKNLNNIYSPVTDSYEVTITDKIYEMDSTLYFQLTLFEKMEENPFKAAERKYPVDFSNPIERSGIIKLTIPENMKIVELPKSTKFVLPNNDASFVYSISQVGNTVNLSYKLLINKTKFLLGEYNQLKAFYTEVIKKEAEPLVLKIY